MTWRCFSRLTAFQFVLGQTVKSIYSEVTFVMYMLHILHPHVDFLKEIIIQARILVNVSLRTRQIIRNDYLKRSDDLVSTNGYFHIEK